MASADPSATPGVPSRVVLRCFAGAREAAGRSVDEFRALRVGDVLAEADARYGPGFAALRATCRTWVNGEPADDGDELAEGDEVAVLPPVSGGAR